MGTEPSSQPELGSSGNRTFDLILSRRPPSEKGAIVDDIVAYFDEWVRLRLASLSSKAAKAEEPSEPSEGTHIASPASIQDARGNVLLLKLLGSDEGQDFKGFTFGTSSASTVDDGNESSKPEGLSARRLACPFLKHDPRKYRNHQSCAWLSWTTVHRVKRHLLPKWRCNRCRKSLKSQADLSEHQRMVIPCEIKQGDQQDGIDETQQQLLRSRKKSPGSVSSSEEEKWARVYQILFPAATFIPSPYYDSSVDCSRQQSMLAEDPSTLLRSLEDYTRAELPGLIRPELAAMFDDAAGEAPPTDRMIDVARQAFESIIQAFIAEHPPQQQSPEHVNTPLSSIDMDDAYRDAVIDPLQTLYQFTYHDNLDPQPEIEAPLPENGLTQNEGE